MADILKLLAIAAKGDRLAYFERKACIGLAIQNIHRQTSPTFPVSRAEILPVACRRALESTDEAVAVFL